MSEISELVERIRELERENESLREWCESVNKVQTRLFEVLRNHEEKINEMEQNAIKTEYRLIVHEDRINSIPYEILDPDIRFPIIKPNILTAEDTLRIIIDEHKSLARFGDGEFGIMQGKQFWKYQDAPYLLGLRLREVLETKNEKVLIALNPDFYINHWGMNDDDAMGVRAYMTDAVRRQHAELIDVDRVYGSSLCFNSLKYEKRFDLAKEIWNGKKCVFVEGKNTGLGVGNDLFDNCREIHRVICPAENAYDRYDEIFDAITNESRDALVLIALGPTATVLAYDLANAGFQAIDIGALDLIYESSLRNMKGTDGLLIPYKYCTADIMGHERIIEDINDPVYLSQIVKKIY